MFLNRIFSAVAPLLTFVAVFSAGAQAQQAFSVSSDDRYNGYPRSLVQWPTAPPDIKACVAMEFYEPDDVHLMQYVNRVQVAGIRVQRTNECRWEDTRYGWRWVLRPAETVIAIDDKGRDLFDYGVPGRKRCGNPTPFGIPPETPRLSIPAPPLPAVVVPPASPEPVAPPKQAVVLEDVGRCHRLRYGRFVPSR